MKYLDEFRDPALARTIITEIERSVTKPWTIMEICGGQTHSIIKNGIDQLLPSSITLIHGPGCPVCVTSLELIDKALAIAAMPDVIFCSFGDMLRVPGSETDLLRVKASGGDVRVVYSPLDAVTIAAENPDKRVVFFGVGFETTTPTTAMAVHQARRRGVTNFLLLAAHVLVPPAIRALLSSPSNRVQGFLAAGHVCAVSGYEDYMPIAKEFGVPIVITGFEPIDILEGILATVRQLESGEAGVENCYARVVQETGNAKAIELIDRVFEVCDRKWRGLGTIAGSGLRLRAEYSDYDAESVFEVKDNQVDEPKECQSGMVLRGLIKPIDCPEFGNTCTPQHPLGATMVSSEGACAAYYRYHRHAHSGVDLA